MDHRTSRSLRIVAAIQDVAKFIAAQHCQSVRTTPINCRCGGSEKSPRPAASLFCRIGTIALLLLAALTLPQAARAASGMILRGMASVARPIAAGTFLLYDGPNLVQVASNRRFYNGTFAIPLNTYSASALTSGHLRVAVFTSEDGLPATLLADLGRFNPASQVLFIDPVTTITAAYRNLKPGISLTKAGATVAAALGVGSAASMTCQATNVGGFNSRAVAAADALPGGLDTYVRSVARQIANGDTTKNLGVTLKASGEVSLNGLFLDTAGDIFKEALGDFPLGKPLAGWILDQIFKAPKESQEDKNAIESQLVGLSTQLSEVLSAISQLSTQISGVEKTIIDQIKLTNYQNDAAQVQQHINSLCNMNKQLIFLANADPNENNTSFAANLQTEIQANADNDLSDIWSALEGNGVLGTRSLINEWADLVDPGQANRVLIDSSYLRSAVPNFEYYLGAILVGYNLKIELAHALAFQGAPDLAKQIILSASSDFEDHDDTDMKLIGFNREIGGAGTTGLFAVALPSFFATTAASNPSDPTNPNNWAIDTRSGVMWMTGRSCDGSNCSFAMYDTAGGFGDGIVLASSYMSSVNAALFSKYPELLLDLAPPSRAQWAFLMNSDREDAKANKLSPTVWLASQGFFARPGSNPPVPAYNHFWTSDVHNEVAGPQLFPDWDNWLVDTSVPLSSGRPQFGSGEATENLELVSAAPLVDPNHFLYRSRQNDFSMNVFTPGPAMNTARAAATAISLLNGKVLIAGGYIVNGRGTPIAARTTELYDPATNSFAPSSPPMNQTRERATATLLPNGKVLIAGGSNRVDLYDPTTNTFAAAGATPVMNVSRDGATATLLPNGLVLIAGGLSNAGDTTKSIELYDPDASTFAPAAFTPVMNRAHLRATATLLPNGKVLIAGGESASTELYDSATNSFAPAASTPVMNSGRTDATATLLPNGKVLIAGGNTLKTAELYDPASNTFVNTSSNMIHAHSQATATLLPNGKVLIAGGIGESGQAIGDTELYDSTTDTFTAGPRVFAAFASSAVLLPDSRVIIAGGDNSPGPRRHAPFAGTDLYTQ